MACDPESTVVDMILMSGEYGVLGHLTGLQSWGGEINSSLDGPDKNRLNHLSNDDMSLDTFPTDSC